MMDEENIFEIIHTQTQATPGRAWIVAKYIWQKLNEEYVLCPKIDYLNWQNDTFNAQQGMVTSEATHRVPTQWSQEVKALEGRYFRQEDYGGD